jgi:hypothetical protein
VERQTVAAMQDIWQEKRYIQVGGETEMQADRNTRTDRQTIIKNKKARFVAGQADGADMKYREEHKDR